jgi:hypothetical protein
MPAGVRVTLQLVDRVEPPTTVDNQAIGFMAALAAAGADPATIQALVHGTTNAPNSYGPVRTRLHVR